MIKLSIQKTIRHCPAIHYVWHLTHIDNLPSIFLRVGGLLSKNYLAKQAASFTDISMPEAQACRERKRVFGIPLHDFVPTYICQRNPMMYVRKSDAKNLVWLKIDVSKLAATQCATTDRNAATADVQFFKGIQPQVLNWEVLQAATWCDKPDGKALRCAELLVRERIPLSAIVSAEVANIHLLNTLEAEFSLFASYNPKAFFAVTSYPQEICYADIRF
ncbi:DUF4433 domain-containing protein [Arsukibacterium sp. MJ3]|uniref:DUF4433 domain-containing protein n=1 Tax=Arsukibacterium sp. MJ3 TaxID=1632859 RepID=UPI00069B28A9|nr:DUF4433 domain-containing protein [Arsukibacterium sp. MJ3]